MEPEGLYKELVNINKNMNKGFTEIYDKIDAKFMIYDRRLIRIETVVAISKAVYEKEQKNKDYWKWIIRAASIMGLGSLLAIFWKLIVFGSKLP